MSKDELNKPLGLDRREETPRVALPSARVMLAAGGVLAGALLTIIVVKGDPLGGEPHAVAKIERQLPTASTAARTPEAPAREESPARNDSGKQRETASEVEDASGVRVVRGRGGTAPGSVVIQVPDPQARAGVVKLAALDLRLTEKGRHGPLPRIANGLKPSEAYARPFDAAAAGSRPKIAVLLTGLGIGATVTADAITKLPGEVSFAFAPYGSDLEKQVARARDGGHEVLLQLPMEPFGYPDNDPGPQTLLTDAPEAQNLDRLHWLMGRFQGYVGLTNFMGARLSGSTRALRPILAEAGKRGLVFVDDGSGGRSQIVAASVEAGLPAARGDIILDGLDKPNDFDAAFARAEQAARAGGQAIVIGPALPANVERLNRWLRSLPQKGFVLAPVSALVIPRKS